MITTDEAISWIADVFEDTVDNIKPEMNREDIPGWDSLGVLNLIDVRTGHPTNTHHRK